MPFLLMIGVNAWVRGDAHPHTNKGVLSRAINSTDAIESQCSWQCHNNTSYCLKHHTSLSKQNQAIVSPIYFGTIRLLKASGNYALANIIVYVVFFPTLLILLIVGILNSRKKLRDGNR